MKYWVTVLDTRIMVKMLGVRARVYVAQTARVLHYTRLLFAICRHGVRCRNAVMTSYQYVLCDSEPRTAAA